jgi:hypothetical protein
MNNTSRALNVFISSTSEDLEPFRAAAGQVVRDLGWIPEMMEHFGALPDTSVQACLDKIAAADVVVTIVAFRRGWVPTPEQGGNGHDSITALEVAEARRCDVPVILMLAHKDLWPGRLYEESDEARSWVASFRDSLNQPAQWFDYEQLAADARESLPQFRAKLRQALLAYQERVVARRVTSVKGTVEMTAAIAALKRGALIPFLGPGIYGDGPLGRVSLARALDEGGSDELATAAEMREGRELSRASFITSLTTVLREQASKATIPDVARLLADLPDCRLIISTCLDDVLEGQLRAAGRKFTTIAHVMNSFDGEHDGKVFIRHEDDAVEVFAPRDVQLDRSQLTLYKLLGVPLLETLESEGQIDTTVITESDHLLLLRRLANPATSIPPAIVRVLRQQPLLFLGYDLDLWQYRLVLQLFQTIGRPAGPIAARQPASPVETNAWRRLQIRLLPIDAKAFATESLRAASGEVA